MDSLVTAAAQALASGNALGALNYIALRDDAPALALRGIAMAQLGDLSRAKTLLRRAARAFGPREAVARRRCAPTRVETSRFAAAQRHCCDARPAPSVQERPWLGLGAPSPRPRLRSSRA